MTTATQILSDGASSVIYNYASRQTAVLSDGNRLVAVFGYTTMRWYIYYTTDGVTYTLKVTSPVCSSNVFSMAVEEAGDHLQIVYQKIDSQNLTWARYTKAGTTWTLAGAEENITSAPFTGMADIDCLTGAGACIVIYRQMATGGSPVGTIIARARGTGGAWGAAVTVDTQAINANGFREPVFASANKGGASGGNQNVLIGGVIFPTAVSVMTASVAVATGAISGLTAVIGAPNLNDQLVTPSGYSNYPPDYAMLLSFRDTATSYYLLSIAPSSTTQVNIKLFKITLSGGVWTASSPLSAVQSHKQSNTSRAVAVPLNTGRMAVFLNGSDGISADCCTLEFATGSVINAFKFAVMPTTGHSSMALGAGAQNFVLDTADLAIADILDGLSFAEYNHAVIAPTAVTPANGATVTTDAPTLSATLLDLQQPGAYKRKAKWQLATNSGFSIGVVNVVEADTDSDASSTHFETPGAIISEGTWWIRAATIDALGKVSAWTAGQSFTDSHSPSAINLTPSGGQAIDYAGTGQVVFDWDFTDPFPGDTQSAYQIVVEVNSSGAAVLDTGKVVSSATTATLVIPAGNKNVVLRWKIRLWNNGNVVGNYSIYNTFLVGDAPTVAITAPAEGASIANASPAVTWTFAGSGGRTQQTYRVVYAENFAPYHVAHDSGEITSAVTTYAPPTDILDNTKNYMVTVYVKDSIGLPGQDVNHFSTLWVPPAVVSSQDVDPTPYNNQGFVSVTWDNSDQDVDWISYKVYRKPVDESTWSLAHVTSDVLANYEFKDWLVAGEQSQEYAVVQTVAKFSTQIESNKVATSSVNVSNADYWLVDPDDDSKNILLSIVTQDSFTEEYESADLNLIGRGRKRDYGTRWGYVGSLSAQVYDDEINNRTARESRLALEAMKAEMKSVYLRTPFGDVWRVALGDAQIGRIAGVGVREFHTLTLPYSEVS